jgi:diphosphomevalonate decarboxylase
MKATAKAPANIAFIKYWGRKDEKLRLPANDSISMNLSEVSTITSVEFSDRFKKDEIKLDGKELSEKGESRISDHLDRIRNLAGIRIFAKVVTQNNFPSGTGIASSASGFAALTVAAASAAGLKLSQKQLSIIARQGSGSACRSIPDGFVEWKAGYSSRSSFAHSLFPPGWWDIRDIVVVVGETAKKVSSSEGHVLTESSPFYKARLTGMKGKIEKMKEALKGRNFQEFGEILEEEAINMHAVMMTSNPPLFYWLPKTVEIILAVQSWREGGVLVYVTIDAGPNVHLLCQAKDEEKVVEKLKKIEKNLKLIVNRPAKGTHLTNNHLF